MRNTTKLERGKTTQLERGPTRAGTVNFKTETSVGSNASGGGLKVFDAASSNNSAPALLKQRHRTTEFVLAGVDLDEQSPLQQRCTALVRHRKFQQVLIVVIFANCLILGLQSDLKEQNNCGFFISVMDRIFLICFTLELIVTVYSLRRSAVRSVSCVMNFFIVVAGWILVIVEVTTETYTPKCGMIDFSKEKDSNGINAAGLLRAFSACRILRTITFIDNLWMIVQTFFLCLRPLLWTVLFMFLIVYAFAIAAINLIGRQDDGKFEDTRFTELGDSMMALLQVMTFDEWWGVVEPVLMEQTWTYLYFGIYIGVCSLALMNLVLAVVVGSAMTKFKQHFERQFHAQEEMDLALEEIRLSFSWYDEDNSGYIEAEEFSNNALRDPQLGDILRKLKLDDELDVCAVFLFFAGQKAKMTIHEFFRMLDRLHQVSLDDTWVAVIRAAEDHLKKMERLQRALNQTPEPHLHVLKFTSQIQGEELGKRLDAIEDDLTTLRSQTLGKFDDMRHHLANMAKAMETLRKQRQAALGKSTKDLPDPKSVMRTSISVQTEPAPTRFDTEMRALAPPPLVPLRDRGWCSLPGSPRIGERCPDPTRQAQSLPSSPRELSAAELALLPETFGPEKPKKRKKRTARRLISNSANLSRSSQAPEGIPASNLSSGSQAPEGILASKLSSGSLAPEGILASINKLTATRRPTLIRNAGRVRGGGAGRARSQKPQDVVARPQDVEAVVGELKGTPSEAATSLSESIRSITTAEETKALQRYRPMAQPVVVDESPKKAADALHEAAKTLASLPWRPSSTYAPRQETAPASPAYSASKSSIGHKSPVSNSTSEPRRRCRGGGARRGRGRGGLSSAEPAWSNTRASTDHLRLRPFVDAEVEPNPEPTSGA